MSFIGILWLFSRSHLLDPMLPKQYCLQLLLLSSDSINFCFVDTMHLIDGKFCYSEHKPAEKHNKQGQNTMLVKNFFK